MPGYFIYTQLTDVYVCRILWQFNEQFAVNNNTPQSIINGNLMFLYTDCILLYVCETQMRDQNGGGQTWNGDMASRGLPLALPLCISIQY